MVQNLQNSTHHHFVSPAQFLGGVFGEVVGERVVVGEGVVVGGGEKGR